MEYEEGDICDFCGKTKEETPLRGLSIGGWACAKGCDPYYTVRQRHYANLGPEDLDRLEEEADKEDWDCEYYGAREVTGPELHTLVRLAREAIMHEGIYQAIRKLLASRGWTIDPTEKEDSYGATKEFIHPTTGERYGWVDAILAEGEREN